MDPLNLTTANVHYGSNYTILSYIYLLTYLHYHLLRSIPILFASSNNVSDCANIMDKEVQTFKIPLDGSDDWIKINADQKALLRVAHSPEMQKRLVPAITSKKLNPIDRASLLLDSYALAKANKTPIESVITILKAFTDEDNSIVWSAISGVLNALNILLEEIGGEKYTSFLSFAKSCVMNALNRIGWDPKPTDGHTDKLTRSTILGLVDTFAWNDPSIVAEARRRFDGHWDNPALLPSEYKTTVFKIILMNGGEKEYDQILKSFYATEDNNEKKYAVFSLGATRNNSLRMKTLDWAVKSGDVKLQDFFYPISAVSSSADGTLLAWNYFKDNFAVIKEKLAKASPSLMDAVIVYSTSRFCTHERAKEISEFFKANPLPSSERKITQTVETINTNAALLVQMKGINLAF